MIAMAKHFSIIIFCLGTLYPCFAASSGTIRRVEADQRYLFLKSPLEKSYWVSSKYGKDELVAVEWSGGGDLWERHRGSFKLIDGWSDQSLDYKMDRDIGKTFVFAGGQYSNLNDAITVGLNLHLGSTFFDNRTDFAFTLGLLGTETSVALNLGLLGRILFPINQVFGFHIGSQIQWSLTTIPSRSVAGQTTVASVSNNVVYSGLAGISFYLTQKTSLSLSGVYDSNKSTSVLMGLTHYLNL